MYFINYCEQMQEEQTESHKFKNIQTILAKSSALKGLLALIKSITDKHSDYDSKTFCKSDHFNFLKGQIEKIRIPELNQVLRQIKAPHCIIALPIKREKNFTLFFVIVPEGQKFDWHNHPKMTGISKCIHGKFKISIIDYQFLQKIRPNTYLCPKKHMRVEHLGVEEGPTVSIIEPHAYNIHKIEAQQVSAFFDLLTPDYPDNMCQFLTTISEQEDSIVLEQLKEPSENIDGLDIYIGEMINKQKHIVKTVILQENSMQLE